MSLGEISFNNRFIYHDSNPFKEDNYLLVAVFMVTVPIAYINLLVGLAVGDIEAIRSLASLFQIELQVGKSCPLILSAIKRPVKWRNGATVLYLLLGYRYYDYR